MTTTEEKTKFSQYVERLGGSHQHTDCEKSVKQYSRPDPPYLYSIGRRVNIPNWKRTRAKHTTEPLPNVQVNKEAAGGG